MKLVRVPGRQSLPVFRAEGFSRKFVHLVALAQKLRTFQRDTWLRFCEANTTEFWRYVPWVVVRPNARTLRIELEVPLWGTEPNDEDFLSGGMYVDANWAWDVLTLYKLGARSVRGSKHHHDHRWRRSTCGRGSFACLWRSINPHSNSGIGNYYSALFAHGAKGGEIIEVPKNTKWYQPPARRRPRKGTSIPEGQVLGAPSTVPVKSS